MQYLLNKLKKNDQNASENKAMYIYCEGKILNPRKTIDEIFSEHKKIDGFLYLKLQEMNSFGN